MSENDDEDTVRNILQQLNKMGLSALRNGDYSSALAYFKKAESIASEEMTMLHQNPKMYQMVAITYNNLACYYKKTKKPKVALQYLQSALDIEVNRLNDWLSVGSTHLNICATYSSLEKHEQALSHIELALKLLERHPHTQGSNEDARAFNNIRILCCYNKAIEQELLKQYSASLDSYKLTLSLAGEQKKYVAMVENCKDAVARIEGSFELMKKRMINIFLKKKEDQEKGHYRFMRKDYRNRENIKSHFGTAHVVPQPLPRLSAKPSQSDLRPNRLSSLYRSSEAQTRCKTQQP